MTGQHPTWSSAKKYSSFNEVGTEERHEPQTDLTVTFGNVSGVYANVIRSIFAMMRGKHLMTGL